MAKSAAKRPANPPAPAKGNGPGGMRPVLLAAGLGLFWYVQFQDAGNAAEMPMWGYMTAIGVRLLADFVGAWVAISGVRLLLALGRLGFAYLRGRSMQENRG